MKRANAMIKSNELTAAGLFLVAVTALGAYFIGIPGTEAQTAEHVLFESTDGHLLANWTPWESGRVEFDAVLYGENTHVTIDFALSAAAERLNYSHKIDWAEDGDIWAITELTDLPAGRQQHTLELGPKLDHTVVIYFNLPGVTLYSATLHAEQSPPDDEPPPDDDPPPVDDEFDIVWSPAQAKMIHAALRAQGINIDPGTVIKYSWTDLTAESPVPIKRGILTFE